MTDLATRLEAEAANEIDAARGALLREAAAVVRMHRAIRTELRQWWSFNDRQQHTHNWHTCENFLMHWDRNVSRAAEAARGKA